MLDFSSPTTWWLITSLVLGLSLTLFGLISLDAERRRTILQRIARQSRERSGLDQLLDRIPLVVQSEQQLARQMAVLDVGFTPRTVTKWRLGAGLLGVFVSITLRNVLLIIPLALFFMQIPLILVEMQIRRRLRRFSDQIQEGLSLFLTEYTTTRSVNRAIEGVIPKLPNPLRGEFERMARKINSGVPLDQVFAEFADRTQNRWALIYSQLMITYYRTGSDFTEALHRIIQDMSAEKVLDQQNETELNTLKILHLVLTLTVPVAFVLNLLMNPQDIYVFTELAGGRLILVAAAVAILFSVIVGRQITEF